MRLIAGSILVGFTLLAQVLGNIRIDPSYVRTFRPEMFLGIPDGINALLWLFLIVGIGLIIWELIDVVKSRKNPD